MKKEHKHHDTESVIGKIIYGTLLFLPLFAILTTCLVTMFNKNVNIEEQQEIQINVINNYEDLQKGKNYYFNSLDLESLDDTTQRYTTIYINNIKIQQSPYNTNTINNIENKTTYFRIYRQTNYNTKGSCLIYFFDKNNNTIYNGSITSTLPVIFKFNYEKVTNQTNYQTLINSIYQKTYSNVNTQNVFYYAIEQIKNSELFNWTQNSIIYTGISATTTALNIDGTFIPMLLTYWLIMSVLYFLYDIILVLVQIIHKKIHELESNF